MLEVRSYDRQVMPRKQQKAATNLKHLHCVDLLLETQTEGTFIKEKTTTTTCSFNLDLYIKSTKPHEVRPSLLLLGHLPVQAQ